MRVSSKGKLDDYQVIGDKLRIHWDHEEVTVQGVDEEEPTTQWQCEEAVVKKTASRDEIIEAVIGTKYPTYGAEIAAIRNGSPDVDEHAALRDKAKVLADGWFK
jgi:hypothetical protein